MGSQEFIFALLGILLAGSNFFWIIVVHRLLNKLMSRNYGEYVQAELARRPQKTKKIEPEIDPEIEMIEKKRVTELNQLMGII